MADRLQLVVETGVSIVLAAYVYIVIRFLSRKHYELIARRRSRELARYLTRKFVHIAGAGPATLLVPLLFSEPFIPSILALSLAGLLYYTRRTGRMYYWFQEETNKSEIVFVISWAASILLLWWISPWLAFFPVFALSIGDGVTGYVRGLRRGKRVKTWEGTIAMMLATSVPGYAVIGIAGLAAGIAASLAERLRLVDDNISIPLVSGAVLAFAVATGNL